MRNFQNQLLHLTKYRSRWFVITYAVFT